MCKRYINWLPLSHPQLGSWPTTQACALTGNQTGDLSVCQPALNPLSHACQGPLEFSLLQISQGMPLLQADNGKFSAEAPMGPMGGWKRAWPEKRGELRMRRLLAQASQALCECWVCGQSCKHDITKTTE